MGPIMIDVHGTSLTAEDKELLQHPRVGGLILFTRNYQSPEQISALTADIRKAAKKDLLIAVDHEGGRVQRFREGFSIIPAMGDIWQLSNENLSDAKKLATQCGILMAQEVRAVGIDISFSPILDINGVSAVIGKRAFHQQPDMVITLASAFIDGMHQVGMGATGKHFPGHGSVEADSHFHLPVDPRAKGDVFSHDLLPFKTLIDRGMLSAIMPAHVIFPDVDKNCVGFSSIWLKDILRGQLGFKGVIFSDDLSMEGAASIGGYVERAEAAQQAGCDMLLMCNNREGAVEAIEHANINIYPESTERLRRMLMKENTHFHQLAQDETWQSAKRYLSQFKA